MWAIRTCNTTAPRYLLQLFSLCRSLFKIGVSFSIASCNVPAARSSLCLLCGAGPRSDAGARRSAEPVSAPGWCASHLIRGQVESGLVRPPRNEPFNESYPRLRALVPCHPVPPRSAAVPLWIAHMLAPHSRRTRTALAPHSHASPPSSGPALQRLTPHLTPYTLTCPHTLTAHADHLHAYHSPASPSPPTAPPTTRWTSR